MLKSYNIVNTLQPKLRKKDISQFTLKLEPTFKSYPSIHPSIHPSSYSSRLSTISFFQTTLLTPTNSKSHDSYLSIPHDMKDDDDIPPSPTDHQLREPTGKLAHSLASSFTAPHHTAPHSFPYSPSIHFQTQVQVQISISEHAIHTTVIYTTNPTYVELEQTDKQTNLET